jgi:hypothetical protein
VARVFLYGAGVGSVTSIVLYLMMSLAVQHPRAGGANIVFRVATVLWPTAQMLMAVHSPGPTVFGVTVLALAVLSNGVLYAVVAVVCCLALKRMGIF